MLRKELRLNKSKDIERAAKRGRAVFSKNLGIKYISNSLPNSRFAVVVSIKVHKKATKRNRIKRQTREIIHLNLSRIKTGFDILIITKPSVIGKTYKEIQEEILAVFEKADLLTN